MKKRIQSTALSVLMLLVTSAFSQSPAIQPCDTYAAMEQYFSSNPEARVQYEELQKENAITLQEYLKNNANNKVAATEYTIPVVFHILHQGGAENISDAQCISALNQMNSDLAKLGADASTVASPFNNLYIPSDIKLMLAKKDPNGNCTNGIVHRYDSRTIWNRNGLSGGASWAAQYNGITWNPQRYLNIIIVKDIVAAVGQTGIVVGYTFRPGTAPATVCDAVVYNYSFLGGTSARSLTHELGHWLDLAHTFGNTNNPGVTCSDDNIPDTPPTKGYFSTCPSSASGNVCATVGNAFYAAGQANVENIMDYSSCPKNFTTGQTNVMRNVLASGPVGRPNLSSGSNLSASFTDVNGLGACSPIADFYPNTLSYTVCQGGSLTMRDFSYNAQITSYQWAADNSAVIASPNSSNTSISFPVAGTCNVTLTASNPNGSNSVVKAITVINATPGMVGPIVEGFESAGLPANWAVLNPNANSVTWAQTNTSAYEGFNSFSINTFANQVGHEDMLITPIIDLVNNPGSAFSFRYAYAKYTAGTSDELAIEGSKDCGGSWQNIYTISASIMANGSGGTTTNPFFPQPDQWKLYDLSTHPLWNSYTTSNSVMFRFKFKSAGVGNYIYIDAVNLDVPTGINELTRSTRFALYPNPSDGAATVSFNLNEVSTIALNVYDVSGRLVENTAEESYSAGEHQINFNQTAQYKAGIYFVELSVNGAKMSKKFVVQ